MRRLVAVQAQDYPGARWALALRTPGVVAAEVDALLAAGRILRTHVLRPTWHLVLPSDIRWLLRLTAPRVLAGLAGRHRQLDIAPALVRRSQTAIVKALRVHGPLTRAQIERVLAGSGLLARGERLGHLLMRLELDEVIVSGGLAGKQQSHVLLDDRAPPLVGFDREQALVELARRYLAGHGPAQDRDLAWWAWLTLGDARRAIAGLGRRVSSAVVEGKTFCFLRGGSPPAFRSPLAHLLPNFDEYDVAYQDHRPNLHPVLAQRPRALGALVSHIVSMDGVVIGSWRRTFDGDRVAIHLALGRRLKSGERTALQHQADRYAAHLALRSAVLSSRRLLS